MSIYCITYVWQTAKEHGTPLLVLLALADYANDDGECWPGIAALAKKSRVTDRNLQLLLRKLESDGTITTKRQEGKHTGTGQTNKYLINGFTEWLAQVQKIQVSKRQGVKSSASRGEIQSSQGVKNDSPDPSVTVNEPSITAPDGAVSNGKPIEPLPPAPKPKQPKEPKTRKRDPVFDAVGEHIYSAPYGSAVVGVIGGLVGKTTAKLKALLPTITAQNVIDYAHWDKFLPKDAEKVALHFSAWLKESVSAPVPVAPPRELTDWEKAEQEAIVTLMNVRAR